MKLRLILDLSPLINYCEGWMHLALSFGNLTKGEFGIVVVVQCGVKMHCTVIWELCSGRVLENLQWESCVFQSDLA